MLKTADPIAEAHLLVYKIRSRVCGSLLIVSLICVSRASIYLSVVQHLYIRLRILFSIYEKRFKRKMRISYATHT